MAQSHDDPVIVIGGSLVGLSAALFLSHWKVPVVVLERHPSSALHPRAVGYTARTIEFLKTVGASEDLKGIMWKGGPPKRVVVESLAGKWENEVAWTEKRTASAPPASENEGKGTPPKGPPPGPTYSHVQGVAVAQDIIEPVLRNHAIRLGAELRLGHKVLDWTQDDEGVTVTATNPDRTEYSLRGQYLVACDGARSPVREKLGIKRQGVGILRALRSILFKCPRINKYLDHGYSQFQIENGEFEAFMTTYGEGRWMLAWNDGTEDFDSPETKLDLIRKATGLPDLTGDDVDFITTGQWDIGGLVADEYSSGRVFLAGDAAHALPPNRAGFGANTGIADVHNLAWKLASVLQGKSRPEILKTYTQERQPVAVVRHDQIFARQDYRRYTKGLKWPGKDAELLDDNALEFGQIYHSNGILEKGENLPLAKVPTEWKAQPGTRAAHVSLRKDGETISTLDLFGTEWVVISSDEEWKQSVESTAKSLGINVEFACIGKDIVEEVEGSFNEVYGLNRNGAALVRPDGVIAWKVIEKLDEPMEVLAEALSKASYAAKSN
ncbi:unnamed protein product [Clonostachys rosea]|uniref:FAD-binding domain-containing protein n=1 Tax=Bionectria ochroleuca TaxID=29856 RepID=A0ABY6UBQ6_BIOOC|nr:unnamed protein product [Clonostachys rosea]